MLDIDISSISDDDAIKQVVEQCALFGTVKSVRLFRTADPSGNQFALVVMSSPNETDKVVAGIGDAGLGDSAVIRFASNGKQRQGQSSESLPQVDFSKTFEKILLRPDEPLIETFAIHFQGEILEFRTKITDASYVWLGFQRMKGERRDLDAASLYLFNGINCLAMSMRLLLCGYLVPSGNLCRNVIESIAIASLISDPKTKCFERLESNYEFGSKAVYWMKKHADALGYKPEGVQSLIDYYKFFHNYSHPSLASLSSVITCEGGPLNIGGIFSKEKLNDYKTEIKIRIYLATMLANAAGVISILQCSPID